MSRPVGRPRRDDLSHVRLGAQVPVGPGTTRARQPVAAPAGRAVSDVLVPTVSDELEQWLGGDQPKTLGNLTELFGPRSFALVFVL